MRQVWVFVFVLGACSAAVTNNASLRSTVLKYLQERVGKSSNFDGLIKCAGQLNLGCFLNKADEILAEDRKDFMVEADKQALVEGRKADDEDETPSSLIHSITSLFNELAGAIFKNGIGGYFRDGKDNGEDDDDEEEEETGLEFDDDEEEEEEDTSLLNPDGSKKEDAKGRSLKEGVEDESEEAGEEKKKTKKKKGQNGSQQQQPVVVVVQERKHEKEKKCKKCKHQHKEHKKEKKDITEARGKKHKKKKEKLKATIKLLILGIVMFAKITLLLKVLAAHLQIKFLIIAFLSLAINAARFYIDIKKGHNPQKVIYYEHAQHQHHYDNEEDWGGTPGHGGGGYWGRSYDKEEEKKTAQDMAYSEQKPAGISYTKVNDNPNFSWF